MVDEVCAAGGHDLLFLTALQGACIVHARHALIHQAAPSAHILLGHGPEVFHQGFVRPGFAPHLIYYSMEGILLHIFVAPGEDLLGAHHAAEGDALLQELLRGLAGLDVDIGLLPVGDLPEDQAGHAPLRCKHGKIFHRFSSCGNYFILYHGTANPTRPESAVATYGPVWYHIS